MWFWPNLEDFKYGRDFNISLEANGRPNGINLTLGENSIPDAGLVIYIRPTTGTNVLTLTIENPRILRPRPFKGRAQTQVGVTLNAENNSLNCHGGKFYDGDVKPLLSLPGNDNVMIISPQKSIYLEDIQPCRHSPYNEEIVKFVEREYVTKCSKPCKPKYLYYICNGLVLSKIVKQLDYCSTDEETKCLYYYIVADAVKQTSVPSSNSSSFSQDIQAKGIK